MQRRQFLALSGLGLAGMLLPNARLIAAEELLAPADVAKRKALADTVLALARRSGASYCDVRIGRYLNQAIITRENHTVAPATTTTKPNRHWAPDGEPARAQSRRALARA